MSLESPGGIFQSCLRQLESEAKLFQGTLNTPDPLLQGYAFVPRRQRLYLIHFPEGSSKRILCERRDKEEYPWVESGERQSKSLCSARDAEQTKAGFILPFQSQGGKNHSKGLRFMTALLVYPRHPILRAVEGDLQAPHSSFQCRHSTNSMTLICFYFPFLVSWQGTTNQTCILWDENDG